ncbi:MAG: 2-phosphosulfolactate phosphatase [Deltaproteobacteria bacterium]|nr:2-phosphosulfolactate phosphatase [Deltaproteobacteria bacterium]
MQVIRRSCAKGAREASGLVVIIDVFRAFSCEPLFFHFGAARVILEADAARALATKINHPKVVLVGEVDEVPLDGADLGNSPSEIILKGERLFKDKTVIHRTTAGVTGATAALDRTDEVILGSFMTAKAVVNYIKGKTPSLVTLVAMGDRAEHKAFEDEACADYIEHLLTGKPYDPVSSLSGIVFQSTAQKFITGSKPYLPREDPIFCLQRDLFDFVLVARKEEHLLVVFKIDQCSSKR